MPRPFRRQSHLPLPASPQEARCPPRPRKSGGHGRHAQGGPAGGPGWAAPFYGMEARDETKPFPCGYGAELMRRRATQEPAGGSQSMGQQGWAVPVTPTLHACTLTGESSRVRSTAKRRGRAAWSEGGQGLSPGPTMGAKGRMRVLWGGCPTGPRISWEFLDGPAT